MEKWAFLFFSFLFSTALCLSPPSVTKRYRSDYEYNSRTDAFYKLHTESRRDWMTNVVCRVEGAELLPTANNEDIIQVHGMMKRYPDIGQYVRVADDGRQHESAEEPPIIKLNSPQDSEAYSDALKHQGCIALSRSGKVESFWCHASLPFVCKVDAKNAPYDPHCDVFSQNYQYNASVGSCYKIPRGIGSWNEAYAECRAEGAHLVVLNSETERAVVQALILDTPRVKGAQASFFFFAGFRANKPVGNETIVFKTIYNQTLQEAGFAEWSPNEPNNALGNEFCGTIFQNDGKLNDVDCSHEYAYICEKEVPTRE